MKKLIMALAALMCFAVASPVLAQDVIPAQPTQGDPVVDVPQDDVEMNAAIETARRTYARFLEDFRAAPETERRNFIVKLALPTEAGSVEHIWAGELRADGERLTARLINRPDNLPGLQRGSELEIVSEQVSDWAIMNPTGMYGNFTDRVVLEHLPAAEADRMRASLSPSPLPPSWTN